MKTKLQIIFLLYFVLLKGLIAQTIPQKDSLPDPPVKILQDAIVDSLSNLPLKIPKRIRGDTLAELLRQPVEKVRTDNTRPVTPSFTGKSFPNQDSLKSKVKYSEDALDEQVDYEARDSQRFDAKNQVIHLYGAAQVKYDKLLLKADYIVFSLKDNIATAEGMPDSLGQMAGTPEFDDGTQQFGAKKLRYNFKSGKGIIYDAKTQQNDMFLLGKKAKYVTKDESKNRTDDVMYTSGAIITTCNHPGRPHFGFRSKKIKVIPDKVAVVGPSNLEIAGVATPIVIPFGFFPLSKHKSSGLLQGDFDISESLGFGLQNWGWYFPLSEKFDLTLRGDLYSRGSFAIRGAMNYKKRYKYSGNLNLNFSDFIVEPNGSIETVHDRSIGISWQHRQDQNAHPTRTFSGRLNFQTNDFQSRNFNDPDAVLENIISSNLSYSQSFTDKPYRLSMNFSHSQNTRSRAIRVDFPSVDFQVETLYPFKSKKPKGNKEKWFEKIGIRYSSKMQTTFTGTDTTFFTKQTLEDVQFGIKHDVNMNASFNILKYFSLSPSINFKENWYFNYLEKQFDPTLDIDTVWITTEPGEDPTTFVLDTVGYGTVEDVNKFGFKPLHLFDASINLNTKIFGTLRFKKGILRGLRHVITPRIGFSFSPDYTSDFFNYYQTVDTDVREDENVPLQYSIFDNNIFDRPTAGRNLNLTYGIKNLFEAKYYSKRDSTEKKFKILNSVDINGRYNLAADTLKFSVVTIRANGSFFKGITNFTFDMTLDPYSVAKNSRTRINSFYFDETGRFLRFVNANFTFSNRLSIRKIKEIFQGKSAQPQARPTADRGADPQGRNVKTQEESFWSWFEDITIDHQFRMSLERMADGTDTLLVRTNNIRTQGSFQLTKNWRLDIRNISYDLKSKQFTFPSLGFSRDLHCWEMSMMWTPGRNSYTFSLRVKPGSLGFLSVPWKRNNTDGSFQFR